MLFRSVRVALAVVLLPLPLFLLVANVMLWTGAVEALKHGWVPIAVRADAGVPAGNVALLGKGAWPISRQAIGDRLSVPDLLAMAPIRARVAEEGAAYDQPGLFDERQDPEAR